MSADNTTMSAVSNVEKAIVAMPDTKQESTLSRGYPRSSAVKPLTNREQLLTVDPPLLSAFAREARGVFSLPVFPCGSTASDSF